MAGGQTASHPDVGNRIARGHDESAPIGNGEPQPRDNCDHGDPQCRCTPRPSIGVVWRDYGRRPSVLRTAFIVPP